MICFLDTNTSVLLDYEQSLLFGEVRRASRKYQFKKQLIFNEPREATSEFETEEVRGKHKITVVSFILY